MLGHLKLLEGLEGSAIGRVTKKTSRLRNFSSHLELAELLTQLQEAREAGIWCLSTVSVAYGPTLSLLIFQKGENLTPLSSHLSQVSIQSPISSISDQVLLVRRFDDVVFDFQDRKEILQAVGTDIQPVPVPATTLLLTYWIYWCIPCEILFENKNSPC